MESYASASEIVEVRDEQDLLRNFSRAHLLRIKLRETEDKSHGDLRASPRVLKDNSKKSISGISESPNLKQALRKLSISQASEMAAMKRTSKRIGVSSISDAGTIERLYASLAVETCKSNLIEASTVPKKSNQVCKACVTKSPCKCSISPIGNLKVAKIPNLKEAESKSKSTPNSKASLSNLRNGPGPSMPSLNPCLINACSRKKGKNEVGIAACKTKSACSKPILPTSGKKSPGATFGTKSNSKGANKADLKVNGTSRSMEIGESSQSSKSSVGEYSSSTSISEESNYCGSSNNCNRPHMSKDVKWAAIHHVIKEQGSLGLKNFKLLKRLGCGDIGTVYLADLLGTGCVFALKVMDIEFLVRRKKMLRAQTERDILQKLDHPFLPTLYAHFTTDNLSFLVMEYCPGGDLHVLRQMQPGRSFPETAARFYVAEVLLALEYLHMLGVIYRDLKPENILVRDDGHIMLSDFDLSMRCKVSPALLTSSSQFTKDPQNKVTTGPCIESNCIEPFCLEPSCFTPRLPKTKADISSIDPLPQLVVEPTDARSNSFVGTHEYLAPEIIRGDGHGSSVDWWTLGIFLYELLFGQTPFKGSGNEDTLSNVVSESLRFPENVEVSSHAKDLIVRLLMKEPEWRLGSVRGASEIKQHPFFEGLNWALIRCTSPPEVPGNYGSEISQVGKKEEGKNLEMF